MAGRTFIILVLVAIGFGFVPKVWPYVFWAEAIVYAVLTSPRI